MSVQRGYVGERALEGARSHTGRPPAARAADSPGVPMSDACSAALMRGRLRSSHLCKWWQARREQALRCGPDDTAQRARAGGRRAGRLAAQAARSAARGAPHDVEGLAVFPPAIWQHTLPARVHVSQCMR